MLPLHLCVGGGVMCPQFDWIEIKDGYARGVYQAFTAFRVPVAQIIDDAAATVPVGPFYVHKDDWKRGLFDKADMVKAEARVSAENLAVLELQAYKKNQPAGPAITCISREAANEKASLNFFDRFETVWPTGKAVPMPYTAFNLEFMGIAQAFFGKKTGVVCTQFGYNRALVIRSLAWADETESDRDGREMLIMPIMVKNTDLFGGFALDQFITREQYCEEQPEE